MEPPVAIVMLHCIPIHTDVPGARLQNFIAKILSGGGGKESNGFYISPYDKKTAPAALEDKKPQQDSRGCKDAPVTIARPELLDSDTSTAANSLLFNAPLAASLASLLLLKVPTCRSDGGGRLGNSIHTLELHVMPELCRAFNV